MSDRRLLLAALGALALTRAAAAQTTTPYRETADNGAAWLTYTGVHPLTPTSHWRLHLEGQIRQSLGVSQPQGRLFRTGLLHTLGASAAGGAGYGYYGAHPYGEFSQAPKFHEHRMYEQFELRQTTGVLRWTHRFRQEQRWIERRANDAAGVSQHVGWTYANRTRYQIRSTLQRHGNEVRQPYATVYNELFIAYGRNVTGNVFDQNRAFAGAGYRLGTKLRAEAGYLNQYVMRPSGRQAERNHTIQLAIASDAPLFR